MAEERAHILVVDDDTRLRSLLDKYLFENGFLVSTAGSAAEARAKLEVLSFDLIVLDIMMPGQDGLSFTIELRGTKAAVPILLLTARDEQGDRIAGFEAGADDYLAKPFEPRELVLRINSILRRMMAPPPTVGESVVRMGAVTYHPGRNELRRGAALIRLTTAEANLLRVLSQNPGITLSREDLTERGRIDGNARAVDVQVTRLRRKIEDDPREPRYLHTVRGEGYVLRPD